MNAMAKLRDMGRFLGLIYRDDGTWGPFGLPLPRLLGMRPVVPKAAAGERDGAK
jgi:hypothetical protein